MFGSSYCFNSMKQVEFDSKAAKKIVDENDEISREDFFKFAIDTKLLDFGQAVGDGSLLQKQKKQAAVKEGREMEEKKSSSAKVTNVLTSLSQSHSS